MILEGDGTPITAGSIGPQAHLAEALAGAAAAAADALGDHTDAVVAGRANHTTVVVELHSGSMALGTA